MLVEDLGGTQPFRFDFFVGVGSGLAGPLGNLGFATVRKSCFYMYVLFIISDMRIIFFHDKHTVTCD